MRADRLLALLLLLQHRGRMPASALAEELEVSERTVLRDIDALSAAGVPVFAERGRHGGFALLPGWTTDLTGLTHDEARALLLAGSGAGSGAGGAPELASAMRKVVAALPAAQRATAGAAAGRVLRRPERMLAPPTEASPEGDERLRAVQRAVFARRRVRLRYAARGEDARWRTVDPIGLVEAGDQWYLLAVRDGEDRTYRLSRVRAVEELDEPVTADPVDLERAWEERRAAFRAGLPRLAVRIRIPAARRAEVPRTRAVVEAEHPAGDGLVVLDLTCGGPVHATAVAWSLAPDVEVLSPPELRAAVAARAAAVLARHRPEP